MPLRRSFLALLTTLATLTFVPLGSALSDSPKPADAKVKGVLELPENVFASAPGDEEKAEAKRQQRLQKIQQITFDRRPSIILKAWANPKAWEEEDEEQAQNQESPAPVSSRIVSRRLANGQIVRTVVPTVVANQAQNANPSQNKADAKPKPDPFERELKTFQHKVTIGDWPGVKAYMPRFSKEENKALYLKLVQSLPMNPMFNQQNGMQPGMNMNPQMMQQFPMLAAYMEKNVVSNTDLIAIMECAPRGVDDELTEALAGLVRFALDAGNAKEDFLPRLEKIAKQDAPAKETDKEKAKTEHPFTRRDASKLLLSAGCAVEAGTFLPSAEKAEADNDREALNLLSRHFLALHAKEKKAEYLEKAWAVTQAVLAAGTVDRKVKDEALTRAVDLAVQVKQQLGARWLEESFSTRPERGMEIIAAIGTASARGIQSHPQDPDFRQKSLSLQKSAVDSLLKAAPERGKTWMESLRLLAASWMSEAEFSHQFDDSSSLGPRMRRDRYGNFFYGYDDGNPMQFMMNNPNMPRPIRVAEVLESRPGDSWSDALDPGLKPKFATVCAQLYLKVGEDALAFPYIERLATTHRDKARELAEEFLRVWTKNHDPNSARNNTNIYMFMFGFERKAESIPLTRSKQERNLKELSAWVKKLRALPLGPIDEKLLAHAFTACHSSAEVYRVEAIESVFGSLSELKPETLGEMVQQMRSNLAGVWRQPATQEQGKTKRKERDIRAEVLRGYEVARAVVESGLKKYPESWPLELAGAAVEHDENNYRQELDPTLKFTKQRGQALARFQKAAALYIKTIPTLAEEKETAEPFETWMYASLGACDLPAIDEKAVPDLKQPALIRDAIKSIPGPASERHMAKFANDLFTRMSALSPAVKFRYLRGGFEIVGDHKQAHEARKVYDYYKDLVTEITLDAVVDGSAAVGEGKPFGVFVNLRHTREIERESGGFGRYLQNQNQPGNMNFFYYNYGRPLENYRDKFQDAATKALQEQFQVVSVTFQDEKVNSKASAEYGWRVTPYAYLLLKARSPEVDKLPPLHLDLDFLDTSGYVILPIESPVIPIDAGAKSPPVRPFDNLKITQTLDERQAKDGKLILEVKAVGQGLIPDLDQVLDVKSDGFRVVKADDQGLSVSRFDPEADQTVVISERNWLINLQAELGREKPPATFTFAKAKVDTSEITHQRYVDADLAVVTPVVALEERYTDASPPWVRRGIVMGVVLLAIGGLTFAWLRRPRGARIKLERFQMPDPVTPFTVLGLLRDIQQNNGLAPAKKQELASSITSLERHFFSENAAQEPDLRAIASTWIRQSA